MFSGDDITQSEINRHKVISDNGSILITSAGHLDSGYYECDAFNGVGSRLKKIIQIKVSGKASKTVLMQNIL